MEQDALMKSFNLRKIIAWGIFLVIVAVVAMFAYRFTQGIVTTWEFTSIGGIRLTTPTPTLSPDTGAGPATTPIPGGAAQHAPSGPTPEPWDGATRVNVLLIGLDYRDWEAGEDAPRSDTMILLSLDPLTQDAAILSIPRDLWVDIPGGFGYGKINTAYSLGESNQLPGGGPALAMKTVESVLGIPIQYYAQVDFGAFVRFVDELGGVKLNITEPITIDLIGSGKETKKKLKPGVQTLPGEWALAYARARYTEGGDFDRARRQQQVILAIRDRILEFDMAPMLIAKAPQLYDELSSGIRTNLTLDQAIQLGWLVKDIPEDKIRRGVIDEEHVIFAKSPDGLDILKPIPEKIRLLRDELFTSEGALSPAATQASLEDLAKAEGARIMVLNGAYVSGLAAQTAQYLNGLGLNAPEDFLGNTDALAYTYIIDHTGNPYTDQYLITLMNISSNNFRVRYDPNAQADIELWLGSDWASNNPMP